MRPPLFAKISMERIVNERWGSVPYVAWADPLYDYVWVSRSHRLALFMRDWYLGYLAGGIPPTSVLRGFAVNGPYGTRAA